MPDALRAVLYRLLWRHRLRLIADAIAIGGAAFGAVMVWSGRFGTSLAVAVAAALLAAARRWRTTPGAIARAIETADGTLDNLIVTAVELDERPRPVRAELRELIAAQATERVGRIDSARVVPLAPSAIVAAMVLIGCALLTSMSSPRRSSSGAAADFAPSLAPGSISVSVSPPAYTRRPSETLVDPVQITVLTGSRVQVMSTAGVLREWTASKPESLELRVNNGPSRFLFVNVVADQAPSVRIDRPGRDSAFANGDVTLNIGIEGRDDLGLASLALRYTKASGGGENVAFAEGEVPLTIRRTNEREWNATASWPLAGLDLADGDVLVYRAVARDGNPAGAAVESDAFLVEIGRASEVAGAGFALPSEERKYAISQQMVIYKTEQLQARGEKSLEEWRLIGMEQRMVRAEVVFLSGGEVEDEVEEAAQSNELSEGRLQNQGRAEMLRAINFMSRAEAQLNDGNAADALVFERQALASLERALDRRRYFLRTLPDRSRIDPTRRLTGERREARSWSRDRAVAGTAPSPARAAMAALAAALTEPTLIDGALAAQVAAVDPSAAALQRAAVQIASARDDRARRDAVDAAMRALTAHALGTMPRSMVVPLP